MRFSSVRACLVAAAVRELAFASSRLDVGLGRRWCGLAGRRLAGCTSGVVRPARERIRCRITRTLFDALLLRFEDLEEMLARDIGRDGPAGRRGRFLRRGDHALRRRLRRGGALCHCRRRRRRLHRFRGRFLRRWSRWRSLARRGLARRARGGFRCGFRCGFLRNLSPSGLLCDLSYCGFLRGLFRRGFLRDFLRGLAGGRLAPRCRTLGLRGLSSGLPLACRRTHHRLRFVGAHARRGDLSNKARLYASQLFLPG